MVATPKRGQRFWGARRAARRPLLGNLVASLRSSLAEGIVTTEAKAKALRPIAEKMITKAKKGGLHNHRQVLGYVRDPQRYHEAVRRDRPPLRRPARRLHLQDPQAGPVARGQPPMARIELVE